MEWEQAIKHFQISTSGDYTKLKEYYEFLATSSISPDEKYYYAWMFARAVRHSGASYEECRTRYFALFEQFRGRVEAIYEFAMLPTTAAVDRKQILKECLYVPTVKYVDSSNHVDNELYTWKILCEYMKLCFNMELNHEAHDVWQLVKQRKEVIPLEVYAECEEMNRNIRKVLFADIDSYEFFKNELKVLPPLVIKDIPNIVHIMWIAGSRTFSMIQYLAVRCAHDVQKPTKIYIYNDIEPQNNEWWERIKRYAEIVKVSPPRYINRNRIPWAQHVADVMRLWVIYTRGGIYIDSDLLLTKSVNELLRNECLTMVQETDEKLWNGFLASSPGHPFFERWITEYETKYGTEKGGCWWAGLSVETPMRLYNEKPRDINIIFANTLLPFGFYDDTLYREYVEDVYSDSYGLHLWETEAEKRGVLPKNFKYFIDNPNTMFTKYFGKYAE